MPSRGKQLFFALIPLAVVAMFFALGVGVGRWFGTDKVIVRDVKAYVDGGMLLGAVADEDRKDKMAQAYLDPVTARQELDNYAWAGFQVPTPFVGHAQNPGTWGTATINDGQMRSSTPVVMPKPPGVCRIFLTGGSTAFGSAAPGNDTTIGGYLQSMLNERKPITGVTNYEVMTAANPAWSTTQERIFIVNRLTEFAPDLVVSFSGNNDVHWGDRGRNVLWYRSNAGMHFWSLIEPVLSDIGHGPVREFVIDDSEQVNSATVAYRLCKNVHMSAYALRLQGDTPYLFALQPNLFVTKKPFSPIEKEYAARYDFDKSDRDFGNVIEYHRRCYRLLRRDIPRVDEPNFCFVDMSTVFDNLDESTVVFIDKFHFGDRGNQIIARALLPHVVKELRQKTTNVESQVSNE